MAMIDGPRTPPANGGPARKLVILAHGYGSNGQDLIGLAPYLAKGSPDAAFVSPNAPEPVPGFPGGQAYQWFGLARMDPAVLAAGVKAAASTLDGFISSELARYRLAPSDCALIGFSQGTMMALHVGLRRPEPLAAIIGFAGRLAAPEALAREIRSRPPVLLAHGDRDDRIPVSAVIEAASALATAGTPAMWRISQGSGHTIAEDMLDLATVFLRDAFAGRLRGWTAPERVQSMA